MMKNGSKAIRVMAVMVAVMISLSFGIITDDFETAQDYLTDLSGTIWDQASVSNGADATQDGVLNALNTSDTPGVLTINSTNTHFFGAKDDGVLLYQVVPAGDFDAKVKVVGGDMHSFNGGTDTNHPCGLMVRSTSPKESLDAVRMSAYDHWQWNVTHISGSYADGGQDTPGVNLETEGGVGAYPWLRLERVANVFNTYYSADASNWILLSSFTRDDLAGDVQVGLSQHAGGETFTIEFDHFSLDAGPIPYAPAPKCDAGIYDPTVKVPVDTSLSWAAPNDPALVRVISYDVSMGADEPLVQAGDASVLVGDDITVTQHTPLTDLANSTQYFWRVEATVEMDDTVPGETEVYSSAMWTFKTERSVNQKPNFVFFLVDDLGWMDIGANGSSFYETPNIDRLAGEGVRFTQAYAASPVCSPTRASILTGKNPARNNMTQWIGGPANPDYVPNLPLEEGVFPELLQEAGYKNIFLGKWHLNNQEGEGTYWPDKQGFDINIAGHYRGGLYLPPNNYFSPWNIPNLENGPDGEYMTDRLAQEAVDFIDEHDQDTPFLMYFSFYQVHAPFSAHEEMVDVYEDKKDALGLTDLERFQQETDNYAEKTFSYRDKQDHPTYAAMVESMDQAVGRVLDTLKTKGVEDNTVVIFFSDNGGLSTSEGTPTANTPLRTGKGWLYEGGIREPAIIKWPGSDTAGTVSDAVITSMDFYPTILEMAGLPLRPDLHVDGKSLVPLLKNEIQEVHESAYFHYPHNANQKGTPSGAIRKGDYKLIVSFNDNRFELYNIKEDIGEQHDLVIEMPELRDAMFRELKEWWKDVDARFPDYYSAVVDAGYNVMTWSGEPVTMEATIDDEVATDLNFIWIADPNGAGDPDLVVDISDPTIEDPIVTITNTKDTMVTVKLALADNDDDDKEELDSMIIDVYTDPCQMTLLGKEKDYETDINDDCVVNLLDFVEMASEWLGDYSSSGPADR